MMFVPTHAQDKQPHVVLCKLDCRLKLCSTGTVDRNKVCALEAKYISGDRCCGPFFFLVLGKGHGVLRPLCTFRLCLWPGG